jgi:hypothetical protein
MLQLLHWCVFLCKLTWWFTRLRGAYTLMCPNTTGLDDLVPRGTPSTAYTCLINCTAVSIDTVDGDIGKSILLGQSWGGTVMWGNSYAEERLCGGTEFADKRNYPLAQGNCLNQLCRGETRGEK